MEIEQLRLYRRREVQRLTGLPPATMYRKIAENEFPAPVKIGKRAVAWRGKDLREWIENLEVAQ